jgi:hypothetical protein
MSGESMPTTPEDQLDYINMELQKLGLAPVAVPGETTDYQQALESALITAGQTLALYDQLLDTVKNNAELVKAKIGSLDLKGKILLIQNSGMTMSEVNYLRKDLEDAKPLGIMLMPDDAIITALEIDDMILRLQGLSLKKKGQVQ